jgi:hypothetical protein
MDPRIPLLLALCAPLAAGCFQAVNTGADDNADTSTGSGGRGGTASTGKGGSAPTGSSGSASTGKGGAPATGSGGAPGTSGGPPDEPETFSTVLETPPIEFTLPDGTPSSTTDPCESMSAQVTTRLLKNCAGCHGGRTDGERRGQPPFDYVLNNEKLIAARSSSVPDPLAPPANQIPGTVSFQGMRFLVPGDPDHSRIYVRAKAGVTGIDAGGMPPADVVGLPANKNRMTVSDVSLIRQWILDCVEEPEGGGGEGGAAGGGG